MSDPQQDAVPPAEPQGVQATPATTTEGDAVMAEEPAAETFDDLPTSVKEVSGLVGRFSGTLD